jgi:hypothetical protein
MRVLKLIFEKKNKKITLPSFFLKKIIIIFLDGYLVCQFLFKLPISFHGFFLFDKQLFCFSGLLNLIFIFFFFFLLALCPCETNKGENFYFWVAIIFVPKLPKEDFLGYRILVLQYSSLRIMCSTVRGIAIHAWSLI